MVVTIQLRVIARPFLAEAIYYKRNVALNKITLHLVGCASGVAGVDEHSGDGPIVIQNSSYVAALAQEGIDVTWDEVIRPRVTSGLRLDEAVRELCLELAEKVAEEVKAQRFFSVIGGDHSCAIGTWSGVQDALSEKGDIGLIWIDAHMDAHTPETSESGRIHGMPVASLLGHGYPTLTGILNHRPKIKPENLCLIGVRSFQSGEADFLKRLNVRVVMMDEVKKRGLKVVMQEAIAIASHQTIGYGLTLDLDALDPEDAPGVDVPEGDGIKAAELMPVLAAIAKDPKLITTEIVEFDPERDKDRKTEKLVADLLRVIAQGKMHDPH